ncbi:hypothetical protein KY334_03795 [Candidatus Woesearchaeota archaeon]|nr:hypothetical protein [Candidatus Woesearchaeota archaeon]
MNKKGFVYSFGIVIITLVVIVAAIIFHFQNKDPENLGQTQSLILETYQQAQLNMLKTDLKAKLAAIDTIYFLAKNSGFVSNDCGHYYGVPLLSYKNSINNYTYCNESFDKQFELKFREFFENKDGKYVYFAKKKNHSIKIMGIAKEQSFIDFNEEKDYRKYFYKDSFSQDLEYNYYIYDEQIPDFIEELNKYCKKYENNKISDDLDNCVKDFVNYYNKDNSLTGSIFEIKIDEKTLQDRDILTFQKIKNLEESNFKYCYYDVGKEFKFSDYSLAETTIRFTNNDGMKDSSIYLQRNDGLLSYTERYPVDYAFYRGEFKNNNVLPVDLRKSNFQYSYNYNELTHQIMGQKVEATGIDLYKCDRANENMVCFLDAQTVSEKEDFLKLRPCEFENRKYVFSLEDNEYYPSEGKLTYRFSTYVEDKIGPEFKKDFFDVVPKDFAEDVVLIKWPHSKSNDVTTYDIFLNDVLIKKVNPWADLRIYDEIDWNYGKRQNDNVLDTCQVKKEGSYYQCYYSFEDGKGLLDVNNTYFFKNNNEFVYVLDLSNYNLQKNKIKIRVNDDDNNFVETKEKEAELEDRLPLMPLDYTLFVDPITYEALLVSSVYGNDPIYYSVVYSTIPNNQNMDGSTDNDDSGNLLIYHEELNDFDYLDKNIMTTTVKSPTSTGQYIGSYSLYTNVYYVLQQEDESMKYLEEIPIDLYGHKKVLINSEVNGIQVNGPSGGSGIVDSLTSS